MPGNHALVIWLGGVIIPSLPEAIGQAVTAISGKENRLAILPGMRETCNRYWTGKIDATDLLETALALSGEHIDPSRLVNHISQSTRPDPQIIEILQTLPEPNQAWLLVDYPASWAAPTLDSLAATFPTARRLLLRALSLARLMPDLYEILGQTLDLPQDGFLVIDASLKRAMVGVNNGFQAVHYTYPRRLAQEIFLRQTTQK